MFNLITYKQTEELKELLEKLNISVDQLRTDIKDMNTKIDNIPKVDGGMEFTKALDLAHKEAIQTGQLFCEAFYENYKKEIQVKKPKTAKKK